MAESPGLLYGQETEPQKIPSPKKQKLPAASFDVTNYIYSNFLWRGNDSNFLYAQQKGRAYSSYTPVPTWVPALTYKTPIEGLSVAIWFGFAMLDRNDVDTDERIQSSRSGDNIFATDILNASKGTTVDPSSTITSNSSSLLTALQTGVAPGVVGKYREPVGMKRNDWGWVGIDYARKTKVGTIIFGIETNNFISPNLSSSSRQAGTISEMIFGYAPPIMPELSLKVYMNIVNSDMYTVLWYGKYFEITKNFGVDTALGLGHQVETGKSGMRDASGTLGLVYGGFYVAVNFAYRLNLKFFDYDTGDKNMPLEFAGLSSGYDGKAEDYSRINGAANDIQNIIIQDAIRTTTGNSFYSYTPRKTIPRFLIGWTLGYSIKI